MVRDLVELLQFLVEYFVVRQVKDVNFIKYCKIGETLIQL